jgi:hypothetical protein
MKILNLVVKKKWFDLIVCGEKKIEYRILKPYWTRRLVKSFGIAIIMHVFDEVHFRNGYSKNSPFARVQFLRTEIEENVQFPDTAKKINCFLIYLGNVLEVRNAGQNKN